MFALFCNVFFKDSDVLYCHKGTVMKYFTYSILVLQMFRETVPGAVGGPSKVIEFEDDAVLAFVLCSVVFVH